MRLRFEIPAVFRTNLRWHIGRARGGTVLSGPRASGSALPDSCVERPVWNPGVAAHGTVPHPRLKAEAWRQTKMTTTEKGYGTVPHPRLKAEAWRQTKMTTTEKGCCRALFQRVLRVRLGMTCRRRRWHGLAQPSRGAPGTIEIRWLGNARQACISPSSRPRPDEFPFALADQHQQAGSAMAKQPLGKGCLDFLVVRHC